MTLLIDLLPLFIVRWYATRFCEQFKDNPFDDIVYTQPRHGVLIVHWEATAKIRRSKGRSI